MSNRLMRAGLDYKWPSKDAVLFSNIEKTGGWPLGYEYIGFCHTEYREVGFCKSPHNDGWWTVIASADDYYLWKLSPAALKKITDAAVGHFIAGLRANTDPSRISIKNYLGYPAITQCSDKEK